MQDRTPTTGMAWSKAEPVWHGQHVLKVTRVGGTGPHLLLERIAINRKRFVSQLDFPILRET